MLTKQQTKKIETDKFGIKSHQVNMWKRNFKRNQYIHTKISFSLNIRDLKLLREKYVVKLSGT
jgi:hypothetical protein